MLVSLSGLGAKKVVLTGVSFAPDLLGVMAYDTERDCFFQYFNERLPANFHGTGDIFASAMTGALMQDRSLEQALENCLWTTRWRVSVRLWRIRNTVGTA